MKITYFRGDLTDISAKKETLDCTYNLEENVVDASSQNAFVSISNFNIFSRDEFANPSADIFSLVDLQGMISAATVGGDWLSYSLTEKASASFPTQISVSSPKNYLFSLSKKIFSG